MTTKTRRKVQMEISILLLVVACFFFILKQPVAKDTTRMSCANIQAQFFEKNRNEFTHMDEIDGLFRQFLRAYFHQLHISPTIIAIGENILQPFDFRIAHLFHGNPKNVIDCSDPKVSCHQKNQLNSTKDGRQSLMRLDDALSDVAHIDLLVTRISTAKYFFFFEHFGPGESETMMSDADVLDRSDFVRFECNDMARIYHHSLHEAVTELEIVGFDVFMLSHDTLLKLNGREYHHIYDNIEQSSSCVAIKKWNRNTKKLLRNYRRLC